MTVSSQICKRIYQADGQNRQWAVDFAYLSGNELKVYVTDASGAETDVTAHCMWDEVEHEMIYPTVDSEQDPLPVGSTVTIVRVTTPTQSLHLTQQGVLDASALERGFDKLTLHVQELAEQAQRSIKYPVSSNKTDVDAQTFLAQLQSAQTEALNSALENVAATKNQLQQDLFDERTARQQADGELQSALSAKQNTLNVEGQQAVSSGINAAKVASYNTHLLDTNNPHRVTKAQVGLNNVDNTSDVNKPISTATQAALNAKQNSLTTAQQAAIDSGVTSAAVAQVQTNKEDIAALEAELGEKREWQKPADWIDIRSGALPNSVYFLVGHSADYATYPTFVVKAGVSNSGTYDVFVDGIKQATTASGTETTLNWQTLALESGWDVTYPVALRTHIVRVTPTLSTNTIANILRDGTGDNGILWVHFQLTHAIIINNLLNTYDNKKRCPLCEAVTADGNKITVGNANCNGSFYAPNLKTIPVLDFNNATRTEITSFISATQLKSITLKNGTLYAFDPFSNCPNLRRIETENVMLDAQSNGKNAPLLENLIPINANPISPKRNPINYLEKLTGLKPCVLDFSNNSYFTRLTMGGTASYRINGLKGLTVSNEAPFDSTTSPQINVAYTGMDRNALVNLFKSMPTVSAGQICNIVGTTGAGALTAEDLAIATDKGWTITR